MSMSSQPPHVHKFANLTDGRCHYRIDGPAAGKPLLLIHGATVPGWQFDRIAPCLNRAGWRTIRLDLFGHGYSDRPHIVHDYPLFTRQVRELLDLLSPDGKVDLLGHSLGSAIAARLVLADPERFGSLVMTAPLVNFLANDRAAGLLRVPILGELLIESYVVPMLVRRRTRRYRNIDGGRFVDMFRDQLRIPGFGRSLLSLMRSTALGDQRECYRSLCKLSNPVLVLRGSDDQIMTAAQMEDLVALLPHASFHEIHQASHAVMLTHPEPMADLVVEFLRRHNAESMPRRHKTDIDGE